MYSENGNSPYPFSDPGYSLDEASSETKFSDSTSGYQEATAEYSILIEKLTPFLEEIKDKKEMGSAAIQKAIQSMEAEYYRAKATMSSRNFLSSPVKQIEDLAQNLGRSVGLVLFASHEVPLDSKEKLAALHKAMMKTRFDSSWDHGSVSTNDVETEQITEEAISEEENEIILDISDVVFRLSCSNDEEFTYAISDLNLLIRDNKITDDMVDKESIISVLCNRLQGAKSEDRVAIIRMLRSLLEISNKSKERMADVGFLSVLVKSLARDVEERREAVGLLSCLSHIPDVGRRIGRIKGCIVMLVSILKSGDEVAVLDAAKLLNSLSSNPQYALNMAEAGYFIPLVHYLKEGSDMNKILMMTALSRMELTDQSKASLGEDGAIELLVNMFVLGNFEAKLSALNSLRKICSLKENMQRLVNCGFVATLLQLLFSVTSVLMALREPASAILALIAQSENVLVKQDVAQQMLSLLSLTSPLIQCHLLNALNSIASHTSARKLRRKMRERGAIQLLLPFITNSSPKIMLAALELIYKLSKGEPDDLMQQLGETNVNIIVNIITLSASIDAKAAAVGILSNLPARDKKSTDILKKASLLPILVSLLGTTNATATSASAQLAENITGILIRFTIPSDQNLQRYSVEHGLIPAVVKLLSSGSALAKSRAAACLAQLSQNSLSLNDSKRSRWFCIPQSVDSRCEVHDQRCSISSTFCLVKANAVPHLIQILETDERDAHEAVLGSLATLFNDKIVENGSKFVAKHSGILPIIKVLQSGTIATKEKALWMLERIFSVQSHRVQYGESAQVILLELSHHADAKLRPALARVLSQLELVQVQSSYF